MPNTLLTATVAGLRTGGATAIPAGGGVIQATGSLADSVRDQALAGLPVTIELRLTPWWEAVRDAIGGGPLIVRDGQAVRSAGEDFLRGQIEPRNPRTAVGQRADGRIIMVAVDGRQSGSAGLTVADLADELVRLGAVTAMALDAGGSTTLAFDGTLLNSPSDGGERSVGNSLQFLYYGVYAPPPRSAVISPNGDGFLDFQQLSYKLVRPAEVDARLIAPDGSIFWQTTGPQPPGTYPLRLAVDDANPSLPEGRWRWVVVSTDTDGRVSGLERRFNVNNSLAALRLSRRKVALHPRRGGKLTIRFRVNAPARVQVRITSANGVVRKFRLGEAAPGVARLIWDGRVRGKKVAKAGRYRVSITARNAIGRAQLFGDVIVRRKVRPRSEADSQRDSIRIVSGRESRRLQ